ncbi:hypothetical protein ACO1O0_002686 [Amphichorda felina]
MSSSDKEGERKRDKVGEFLQKNLNKGELALKHAVGLGQQPNVIPAGKPVFNGPCRAVEVGWHPVGGVAGKWFAEETGLGKMITEKINKYPDPTQHWAVLVGDYAHQLWMDESFHVIYTNEKIKREEWRTFQVGETRFNDQAIRKTESLMERAAESVIQSIREKQPTYNLINNNCQTYVLQLLDAVKTGGDKEFGTTLAIYERITGPGKIADLFPTTDGADQGGQANNTVSFAQQVMRTNTVQLDAREELGKKEKERGDKKGDGKKGKSNIFSRLIRG